MRTPEEIKLVQVMEDSLKGKVLDNINQLKETKILEIRNYSEQYGRNGKYIISQRDTEEPKVLLIQPDYTLDEEEWDETYNFITTNPSRLVYRLTLDYALNTLSMLIEDLDKYEILKEEYVKDYHQYVSEVKQEHLTKIREQKEREDYERLKDKFEGK